MAYRIESAQRETNLRDEEVATIQSVSVSNAGSDAGADADSETEQPSDLTLEVELLTLETDAGYQFRGSTLREGNKIAFDLGSRVVSGTVSEL
jgi:hypothetical protein